jgi:hypothetical protein
MFLRILRLFLLLLCFSCAFSQENLFLSPQSYNLQTFTSIKDLNPPQGYKRVKADSNSFAAYLRNLPFVDDSHTVLDFKNSIRVKAGDSSLAAVVPIKILGKRLWQCMDILLVLNTDYLKKKNNSDLIEFPLPEGTLLSWPEWRDGFRPVFSGMQFNKKRNGSYNDSAKNFKRYLNEIFSSSGTQTFFYHYPQVPLNSIKPGDFIVKKGKKGHAVLIIDVAVNDNNEKVALIGQGDTPACQFYLLKNKQGSAWFKISSETEYPDLPIRKKMFWSGLRRFPK